MSLPFIIVLLAVAMAVGPLLLMRPTKKQQREMHLRQKAIKNGFRVQLRAAPKGAVKTDSGDMLAVYSLPWGRKNADVSPWLLVKRPYCHELHFCGVWEWEGRSAAASKWLAPLQRTLAQLPDDVVAVGNGPQGVYVYWREADSESTLEQLLRVIGELRQSQL